MTTLSKAEAAFQHARTVDTCEAWKAAAMALYAVRAQPKAPRNGKRCRYPFPVAVATFADGTVIRRTFFSAAGKPMDWARAERICDRGYRYERAIRAMRASLAPRHLGAPDVFDAAVRGAVVPALLSLVEEGTGERVDYDLQREAA